ncbi:hypothetical protein [Paraburkholderia sacchari]|uniref:hypothetical protein n=1 Tax=Paraburkholderia sacchari TaxID=159450 RepID=UPI00054388AB|nr:hypothetical protein [Paraburkholderia sacchari]NLP63097.1 hypothetical protein [Paraburkholderia sacchari]
MKPTVLGVYESYANARSAQRALGEAGVAQADIAIYSISVDAPREKGPRVYLQGAVDTHHHHRRVFEQLEQLFARIFTKGEYPPDPEDYREFIRRGGTIVSADVSETQVDIALEAMRRTGAADIEERANVWHTGSAKAENTEHPAHPDGAMAGKYAMQKEAMRARQDDTPDASAVRTTPSPGNAAAAGPDAHGSAFSSTDPNLRQITTRAEARGSTSPTGKQSHESGVDQAGFGRMDTCAGLKSHAAQPTDGTSAASKAQRPQGPQHPQYPQHPQHPLGSGYMGDPGLGTPRDGAGQADSEFREDYETYYENTGASYDEYRRAHSHGAMLGRDERYRGADWQGVEARARATWEARYPESAWERFKTAVRHGWERVRRGG